MTCHTVWTPDKPSIIRLDDVDFRPDPPLYCEASVPACIYLDVSAARPDDVQWSISFRFSFQVQIREDWYNRPNDMDSCLDALIHKARILNSNTTVWTLVSLVRMREALYGNYLQWTCDRPDDSASPSGRSSQTGKIFSKNLKNFVAQLSVRTAQVHLPDGVRTYHSSRPFELQTINRGP